MLAKVQQYISQGNFFAALEVTKRKGRAFYGLLLITKEKEELRISNWQTADSLNSILDYLPKRIPLTVIFNNEKVLTKSTAGKVDEPISNVLQAFPNLDINSFYFEIIQEKENPIISIAKKSYVDEILGKLKDAKIKVIGFHLGISSVKWLLPYWSGDQMQTAVTTIELSNNKIQKLYPLQESISTEYEINGLEIHSDQLIALAAVLGFLQKSRIISNYDVINDELETNYRFGRMSEFTSKALIAGFLVLLLLNFFFFSYYRDRASELDERLQISTDQQLDYQALEVSVNQKHDRLERLNKSSWSKSSFYLDILAQDLPESICLDQLIYNPLRFPVREEKPIQYSLRRIVVLGNTNETEDYSIWLRKLEQIDWIKSVETTDFSSIKGNRNQFALEITLNETES